MISTPISNASTEAKMAYLHTCIEHNGVYRVAPGNRPIPGKRPNTYYTWQIYLRRCMFDPQFVFTAAELLVDKLPNKDVQICACEDAGVVLGMAMATILGTPMISIKKSRKVYGLLNFTEGRTTGKPILLVDDVAGSQNTLKAGVKVLEAFHLPIADQYVTLINKTIATHPESYIEQKELISLFSLDDFAMSWNAYVKKFKTEPDFGPIH
jgi:adenine/guanine phosphoribosyltransferase-like PRPP-binding protein